MHPLVTPARLHELLQSSRPPLVFDCSWHMPSERRDAQAEFLAAHIPGAQFFDFDGAISDRASSLPHMLPDDALFTSEARRLGLGSDSRVACYDSLGIFTAPRGWWMLRAMGCEQVQVLDGGLPAWRKQGLPLAQGEPDARGEGDFTARLQPGWAATSQSVQATIEDPNTCILDARSGERFRGEVKEPRPQLRSGHIPGSRNLHYQALLRRGRYKSGEELEKLFARYAAPEQKIITTCGSGVTACILALGAMLAGYQPPAVYDGSWSEWGDRESSLPVAKGAG